MADSLMWEARGGRMADGKVCVVLLDDHAFTEEGLAKLRSYFEQAASEGCASYICVGKGSIGLMSLAEEAATSYWIDNFVDAPEGQIYLALESWEFGGGTFLETLLARFAEVREFRCISG